MEEVPGVHVDSDRDVVMPIATGGVVETQPGDRQRGVPLDGHFPLEQGHRQGLKGHGMVKLLPGRASGYLHRLEPAIAGLDARHLALQLAGVFEVVQMFPGAVGRVIGRAGVSLAAGKSAAARKADGQVKFLPAFRSRLEFNAVHLPRAV